MIVYWDITKDCNFNCIYCYNKYIRENILHSDVPTEQVIRFIKSMNGYVDTIHFLGGEPFLRKNFDKILETTDKEGISIRIATNGSILTDKTIDTLVHLDNLEFIDFSIDTLNETTANRLFGVKNGWKISVSNLRRLLEIRKNLNKKFSIQIEAVITKLNVDQIIDTIRWAEKLGVDVISFQIVKSPLKGPRMETLSLSVKEKIKIVEKIIKEKKKFRDKGKDNFININWGLPLVFYYLNNKFGLPFDDKKFCPAVKDSVYINSEGDIHPCSYASEFSEEELEVIIFGKSFKVTKEKINIKHYTFSEVLNSNYFRNFYTLAHTVAERRAYEICDTCPVRDRCEFCPLDIIKRPDKEPSICRYIISNEFKNKFAELI